jgi:hypothetical protein
MAARDPAEKMIIERDVPITMDDGLVIRADVYRPKTKYPVPVIMTSGPYGKGVKYQEHYKLMWDWLVEQHPDVLAGSTKSFLAWETVDPEIGVPWDYAVIRVDSRGAGRSPGYLDIFFPRETRDYYTPTPRESEDPPCQTAQSGFYRTDDTARVSGQRIAARPDRVSSERVGRSSSGPACERAGVARRRDELRGDCEGSVAGRRHHPHLVSPV